MVIIVALLMPQLVLVLVVSWKRIAAMMLTADVVDYSEFTASPGAPSDLADDRGAHCRLSSASSVNSDVFNRLQKQTAAKMMLQLREGRQVSQIALR